MGALCTPVPLPEDPPPGAAQTPSFRISPCPGCLGQSPCPRESTRLSSLSFPPNPGLCCSDSHTARGPEHALGEPGPEGGPLTLKSPRISLVHLPRFPVKCLPVGSSLSEPLDGACKAPGQHFAPATSTGARAVCGPCAAVSALDCHSHALSRSSLRPCAGWGSIH